MLSSSRGNVSAPEVVSFIKYLYKGIKRFGIIQIENQVRELFDNSGDSHHKLLTKKILQEVSVAFGIPTRDIINSKRRGVVTRARVMSIILFNKHTNLTHNEIAGMLKSGRSLVSKRIKTFEKPNYSSPLFEKIYSDKSFIEKFNNINNNIIAFKRH